MLFQSLLLLITSSVKANGLLSLLPDSSFIGSSYIRLPPILGSKSFACFSTDTWLTTPNGKKRMDQIAVGDMVLTANMTATFFTPITTWMHREPEERYQFYTIMTEYGKMLAVTAKHLVYRNLCDENYEEFVNYFPKNRNAVFADELKIGDCLILLYKGKYRQQRIMRISITERKGIFAPITSNGRIIVNDIIASTYSEVKHIKFQMKYFAVVSQIQEFLKIFGESFYNKVTIPVGSSLASDILLLLLPVPVTSN
ncbi:unnamed protein product [Caenorhabditis bovis]|uniref:Hint domain-containing protein n=1 Tax=Caenorhabditis bovis TaxID=2654633 RepID=A0A8S1EE59_9PELO|nr:unnamed protein product [Caenorhabditis bovis]